MQKNVLDQEIQSLTQAKNRLTKEDRANHHNLVQ